MEQTGQQPQTQHILLVDDDVIIRSAIEEFLSDQGHKVIVAENGKKALELFNVMKTSIRLLITDICMPILDGASLIRQIRQSGSNLPIAVITGYADDTVFESLGRQANAVFNKPLDFEELEQFVNLS